MTLQTENLNHTTSKSSRLADWTDEELLLAYRQQGDRDLFETLMSRYERELMVFLRRFLGDSQVAEDAFQLTFLAIHLRMDQFQDNRRFKPWMYAIASNKAIDCQRRNKRHQIGSLDAPISNRDTSDETRSILIEGNTPGPEDHALNLEKAEQIHAVIGQLNPAMQQLMHLVFFQSMKYADISEKLNIPIGTVKSRVHTAMGKLREIWLRMYPTDEMNEKIRG